MKPDYQRFFLTELVALIQRKYKFDVNNFFFENKSEYIIIKPRFNFQIYNSKEAETYNTIFVIDFLYFKITRFLY
jgi:hypothetical protein